MGAAVELEHQGSGRAHMSMGVVVGLSKGVPVAIGLSSGWAKHGAGDRCPRILLMHA